MATAAGGRRAPILGLLDGRHLLFSEPRQAIFELDPAAAAQCRAWAHDGSGDSEQLLSPFAVPAADGADELLAQVGAEYRRAAMGDAAGAHDVHDDDGARLVLTLSGCRFALRLPPDLHGAAAAALGHLAGEGAEAPTATTIEVVAEGDGFRVSGPGSPPLHGAADEWLPLAKGLMLDHVLARGDYEVALHAAGLAVGGRLLLLCGSPGAGKTVLALALEKAGAALSGDDVMLVGPDGWARGLAFPFAAKAAAWPLLARLRPDRGECVYRRPDRKRVKYLAPARVADAALPVAMILFLDRGHGGAPRLVEIDRVEALGGLIAEGASADERLSGTGFEALLDLLRGARCARLHYGDAREAAQLLMAEMA